MMKMNMPRIIRINDDFSFPSGKIHDDLRQKILSNQQAYKMVLETRKLLSIPAGGFTMSEDIAKFIEDIETRTRENLLSEDSEPYKIVDLYPKMFLDFETAKIQTVAKIPKHLNVHVTAFILCESRPTVHPLTFSAATSNNKFFQTGLRPLSDFIDRNYFVRIMPPPDTERGISVDIFAPLTKQEWQDLKKEAEKFFKNNFPKRRKVAQKKKDIEKDLAILRSLAGGANKLETAYKILDGEKGSIDSIKPDEKELQSTFKQVQRLVKKDKV